MAVPGLGELVERGITKLGGEEFGETFGRTARSMEHHTFNQTDVGKYTKKLLLDYKMQTDANTTKLAGAVSGMSSSQLRAHAAGVAASEKFGNDHKALVALTKYSHQNEGYYYTQNLMDSIAMVLHEDSEMKGYKHVSEFKDAAVKELNKFPDMKRDKSTGQRPIDPKTGQPATYRYNVTSDYVKPNNVEKWVQNMVVSKIAPLIVLPHLGTAMNIVQSTKTLNWAKALAYTVSRQSPAELKQTIISAGLLAEGTMRTMRSAESVRRGVITRFLPGSVQDVMAKISSTPLFGSLRDFQVNWAGNASYLDAIDYGEMFAKNPNDRYVTERLTQYGMTPRDLHQIEKTGQLTPAQLQTAVYYGADRKVFLNTAFARSYHAQRNGLNRSFTMFHGYVSRQALFMGEEFRTSFGRGNHLAMAKAAVTMGVLFPAVGEGLKLLEMVGRGQYAQIPNQAHEDYDSITFQKGDSSAAKVGNAIKTYGEAYSTLGAFGIFYEMFMGAHRGALLMHLAGPAIGRGTQYVEDVKNWAEGNSADPAIRDALEVVGGYGVGHFIGHMYFPSAAEKKRAKDEDIDFVPTNKGRKKKGSDGFEANF